MHGPGIGMYHLRLRQLSAEPRLSRQLLPGCVEHPSVLQQQAQPGLPVRVLADALDLGTIAVADREMRQALAEA
ncbi:hypothetical protein GCM10025880_66120 [Methylorubrum aminovorans]|nr:hypothetical protein GCM10025880_66120 [Methylorubrum aminovorans]